MMGSSALCQLGLLVVCISLSACGGVDPDCAGGVQASDSEALMVVKRTFLSNGNGVAYGVALPRDGMSFRRIRGVIALPTGFQEPFDVERDVSAIWERIAIQRKWCIVVPAASFEAPSPGFGDAGLFGQGPEAKVALLLREVIFDDYPIMNDNLAAVEIGGNGGAVSSIVSESPQFYELVVIVPGLGLDSDAIDGMIRLDASLSVVVIVSESDSPFSIHPVIDRFRSSDRVRVAVVPNRFVADGRLDIQPGNIDVIAEVIEDHYD